MAVNPDDVNRPELGWSRIVNLTLAIIDQLRTDNYLPTYLLAVARGGLIPARLLAEYLKISRVGAATPKKQGVERMIIDFATGIRSEDRVLVVEDFLESGLGLQACVEMARLVSRSVKSASLLVSPDCQVKPDYLADAKPCHIPLMPWELPGSVTELKGIHDDAAETRRS